MKRKAYYITEDGEPVAVTYPTREQAQAVVDILNRRDPGVSRDIWTQEEIDAARRKESNRET